MNIGERLREERQRLGISQAELGAAGGVLKQAQLKYEKGERSPDADYLAALARVGVDVLYVLTEERSFTPPPPISPEHRALIRDYEASSPDGKEAIRRMAAATALGASAATRKDAATSTKFEGSQINLKGAPRGDIAGRDIIKGKGKRKS